MFDDVSCFLWLMKSAGVAKNWFLPTLLRLRSIFCRGLFCNRRRWSFFFPWFCSISGPFKSDMTKEIHKTWLFHEWDLILNFFFMVLRILYVFKVQNSMLQIFSKTMTPDFQYSINKRFREWGLDSQCKKVRNNALISRNNNLETGIFKYLVQCIKKGGVFSNNKTRHSELL